MAEEPTPNTEVSPETTTPAAAEKEQQSDGTRATDPTVKNLTQEEINEMIAKRVSRERSKRDEEIAAERKRNEELMTQLKSFQEKDEQIKRELDEKEKEKLLQKGDFEKAREIDKRQYEERLKKEADERAALLARNESVTKELEKTKIDNALYSLVSTTAVDPEAAVQLLKSSYQFSIDPKTYQLLIDGDADVTPEEKVKEFFSKKPYLAKSSYSDRSGAGSSPSPSPASTSSFTQDQLGDPKFVAEHWKEIAAAASAGRIT